jgi:hypothetical protein
VAPETTMPTSVSSTVTRQRRRPANGSQSAGPNSANVFKDGSKGRSMSSTFPRRDSLSYYLPPTAIVTFPADVYNTTGARPENSPWPIPFAEEFGDNDPTDFISRPP